MANKEGKALNVISKVVGDCCTILQEINEDEKRKIGQKALDCISDYPLYASSSNITYEQAIIVAIACGFPVDDLVEQ